MLQFTTLIRHTGALALLAAAAAAAPVHAVTLETGSYSNSGIGSEFATPYDNFIVTGDTVTVALSSAPVVVSLGTFSFEVGWNCNSCLLTPSFDALIDLTVDGITKQIDLPYSWYSSGPTDFLAFATPAPVVFDFGSFSLTVAADSLGTLASSGSTVYGNLNATMTASAVPEPTSYAMMLAGFGVIALVAKRRRR
jgi:PEP-CTERM motif